MKMPHPQSHYYRRHQRGSHDKLHTYVEFDPISNTVWRVYAKDGQRMYQMLWNYHDKDAIEKELQVRGYREIFPKYLQLDEGL